MPEKDSVADFLNLANADDVFTEAPVVEEIVEEEKDEKPLPFHKDPKVQRYIEKQVEKATKNKPIEAQPSEKVTPSDIQEAIDAFTAIVGNDTPEKVRAIEKYEKALKGSDERAANIALERFQKQQQDDLRAQQEKDAKAQEELDTYFDEIEETYDVDLTSNSPSAKKLRTQFIEYVRKVAHKDEHGEVDAFPDMLNAYEEFVDKNKRQSVSPSRAKELASRGMARSSDTATPTPQGRSWKDVERYFSTLSNSN